MNLEVEDNTNCLNQTRTISPLNMAVAQSAPAKQVALGKVSG